ncbi:MAG: hypothetical protein K2G03_00340 [Bacilli bacterium]|nr:hypothetical protein [Bacilli bacterium]
MKKNLFKKKTKECSICGGKIKLEKEKVYLVRQCEGLFTVKYYNAIDCPYCGCQILLWPRLKEFAEPIGIAGVITDENNEQ